MTKTITEASAARVVAFLTKLRSNWGKRFENEEAEDAWLDTMTAELHVYSKDVLDAAAASLLRSRLKYFPLVGQCLDACVEAKRFVEGATPELRAQSERKRSHVAYEALADELIHGPMGREAARDGWIGVLHGFVTKHGRLPNPVAGEVSWCKREAKDFDENYELCLRNGAGPLSKQLAELGGKMLANRERLRGIVLGDAA